MEQCVPTRRKSVSLLFFVVVVSLPHERGRSSKSSKLVCGSLSCMGGGVFPNSFFESGAFSTAKYCSQLFVLECAPRDPRLGERPFAPHADARTGAAPKILLMLNTGAQGSCLVSGMWKSMLIPKNQAHVHDNLWSGMFFCTMSRPTKNQRTIYFIKCSVRQ